MTDAQHQHLSFVLALHRELGGGGGTYCVSPYSIGSALGMVSQAARGETADELVALLAPGDADAGKQVQLLGESAVLNPSWGCEEPVLHVANSLWVAENLQVNDTFAAALAAWPGAKHGLAPFVSDPEAARRMINADVAETTRDLIPELIGEGLLDEAVAVLVNALYLKVAWRRAFAEHRTDDADFHTPNGTRQVPTMQAVEKYPYAAEHGWQAVGVQAAGEVEATILLPDGDLAEAESTLDAGTLFSLLEARKHRRIDLRLPRLALETNTPLNDPLEALGVRTMFTSAADLSALSPDPRLYVSDVFHQSVLKIDEAGIEGAAATAAVMTLAGVVREEAPLPVHVDRPFLLLVRNRLTGAVYFMARVTDPA